MEFLVRHLRHAHNITILKKQERGLLYQKNKSQLNNYNTVGQCTPIMLGIAIACKQIPQID